MAVRAMIMADPASLPRVRQIAARRRIIRVVAGIGVVAFHQDLPGLIDIGVVAFHEGLPGLIDIGIGRLFGPGLFTRRRRLDAVRGVFRVSIGARPRLVTGRRRKLRRPDPVFGCIGGSGLLRVVRRRLVRLPVEAGVRAGCRRSPCVLPAT
jgi:hypothetical protein